MSADPVDLRQGLASAALYEREIRALADRSRDEAWRGELELTAPLAAVHAPELARRLAREVSAGLYSFAPLAPHAAVLHGKPRTIYRIDPLDAAVFGALARVMRAAIEPRLGDHLYSYRRGRSQWTACRALLRYLRAHERARPDPRSRGLYVLRRDVRRYDEHIRVTDDSSLWTTLARLLDGQTLGCAGDVRALLRRALRPDVVQADGGARPLDLGVPTGLPTQTIACNTYLLPLDAELCALPGAFYARFGDDILFAHPERAVADEAARRLDEGAGRLGLHFNPDKSRALWLTRPGRAHAPGADAELRACSHVPYLGFDIGFDGARLRADKRRGLLRALHARLANADRLLAGLSPAERAAALCEVVRLALDGGSLLADRYATWLRMDAMSREDLRALDHHIALAVAERLAGRRGPRALRTFPPRTLRSSYGLPSLLEGYTRARRARSQTR